VIIYGAHSCTEALKAGRCRKLYLQIGKSFGSLLLGGCPVVKLCEEDVLRMVPKGAVHQGILAEVSDDSYYSDVSDFATAPANCGIAILDGVTDPHNFGAIIRTAAAFGLFGIISSERSSCRINGTVVKAASGGIEHLSVCIVKNIASTIDRLKEYGFWIFSVCEGGERLIGEVSLQGKTCLILGAEGRGIRHLQKEKSDFVVRLPTNKSFSTLNVSNAAAVAFYELAKQNGLV
jgi:23S rRNA (guanosine2251-2'-O)-methyltransferase